MRNVYYRSKDKEYGAIIFKEGSFYFLGDIFEGAHDNVVFEFTTNYMKGLTSSFGNIVGFIHSHPKCSCHVGDEFSDTDLQLLNLPRIYTLYLVRDDNVLVRRKRGEWSDTIIAIWWTSDITWL